MKNWILSATASQNEISNVCNALEGHCPEATKIVHHHPNGRFHWLISEHQRVNPSREAISILSGKYKRFTIVHPVNHGRFSRSASIKEFKIKNLILYYFIPNFNNFAIKKNRKATNRTVLISFSSQQHPLKSLKVVK